MKWEAADWWRRGFSRSVPTLRRNETPDVDLGSARETLPMNPPITITNQDLDRLTLLVRNYHSSLTEALDVELARAAVVAQTEIAGDVVTMNSDVVYEDSATGSRRQVRVVYPKDANPDRGWVSILAPLGSALLGLRVGQSIDWQLPSGKRELTVVEVPYQPEANGEFAL